MLRVGVMLGVMTSPTQASNGEAKGFASHGVQEIVSATMRTVFTANGFRHDEAIATLYVSSKFVFTDPSILLVFASAVPRQNMSHISFIEISAPTVYALFHAGAAVAIRHFEDWQRSVTVLQEMAGLKAVYVVVPNSSVYGGWEQSQTSERYVLEPLLQVKRSLETFVVSIGWYAGGGPGQPDMEAHRYPFELRRFDGHLPGMQ